ncbi:twin-arginine translocation signal domain-containing protein [Tessaracoccus sp. HDW20]|nr:twin-arginine translocation signal domain-containing protein [Tessaracoccus coleopterorum]
MDITRRGLLAAGTVASLATACGAPPRGPLATPVAEGSCSTA